MREAGEVCLLEPMSGLKTLFQSQGSLGLGLGGPAPKPGAREAEGAAQGSGGLAGALLCPGCEGLERTSGSTL